MRQSITNRACDKNNGPPGRQAARRHICTSAAQRGKDMSPATAVCSKSCLLTLKWFVGEHTGEAIVFMIQWPIRLDSAARDEPSNRVLCGRGTSYRHRIYDTAGSITRWCRMILNICEFTSFLSIALFTLETAMKTELSQNDLEVTQYQSILTVWKYNLQHIMNCMPLTWGHCKY